VNIRFANTKLEKKCSDEKEMQRHWGSDQTKKLKQRLTELKAAANLGVMKTLPAARAHTLKANRQGQISLDLKDPYRLIVAPDHEETPLLSDGGLDWDKVTKVNVLEVTDTHD